MRLLPRVTAVLVAALTVCSFVVRAQSDADYTRALIYVYAIGKTAEYLKNWCDDRAPSTSSATAAALEMWRTKNRFELVQSELFRLLPADRASAINEQIEGARTNLYTQLDTNVKDALGECQNYGQYLDQEADPRKLYPNEMRILDARLPAGSASAPTPSPNIVKRPSPSSPTTTTTASPPPAQPSLTVGSSGVVYTVAQIGAVFESAKRKTSGDNGVKNKAGEAAIRALGRRIVVTGTLNDDGRWLEWRNNRFESKIDVNCDFRDPDADFPGKSGALKPYTIIGTFKEYDVFFDFTDCVRIPSLQGLKPSTLDYSLGVRRFELPRDMFLVNPGAGLKDNQIYGVFLHSYYAIGVGGYGYIQYEPYLYLKDGTVYNDPFLAPNSFNVALSKKEEPQKWGKWTRKGDNFTITWNESDDGKPETKEGIATQPGSSDQRLEGYFENISGGGNTAFGGNTSIIAYNGYTFKRDGTFSRDGGAGGSSGNDYTGNAPNVSFSTQNASARGTYKISGYNIELKFADGKVWRRAFTLAGGDKDRSSMIYIGGTYYIKK
jgi:hypothetical protein